MKRAMLHTCIEQCIPKSQSSYLVHLLLDLCVLSALPVASGDDVLVAVLVHLVVDIVALVVSARLVLIFVRRNGKLFHA